MNMADRIQYLRKSKGISQEEERKSVYFSRQKNVKGGCADFCCGGYMELL